MNSQCALVGHIQDGWYDACDSYVAPCRGCDRIICARHNRWVKHICICDECVANDVPFTIDSITWSASVLFQSDYIEFYKRLYCIHTKRAIKTKS